MVGRGQVGGSSPPPRLNRLASATGYARGGGPRRRLEVHLTPCHDSRYRRCRQCRLAEASSITLAESQVPCARIEVHVGRLLGGYVSTSPRHSRHTTPGVRFGIAEAVLRGVPGIHQRGKLASQRGSHTTPGVRIGIARAVLRIAAVLPWGSDFRGVPGIHQPGKRASQRGANFRSGMGCWLTSWLCVRTCGT